MKMRKLGIATLVLLTTAGSAMAAGEATEEGMTGGPTGKGAMPQQSAVPAFKEVDKDHDGAISDKEAGAVPGLIGVFTKADTNGDGKLSPTEYARIGGHS